MPSARIVSVERNDKRAKQVDVPFPRVVCKTELVVKFRDCVGSRGGRERGARGEARCSCSQNTVLFASVINTGLPPCCL